MTYFPPRKWHVGPLPPIQCWKRCCDCVQMVKSFRSTSMNKSNIFGHFWKDLFLVKSNESQHWFGGRGSSMWKARWIWVISWEHPSFYDKFKPFQNLCHTENTCCKLCLESAIYTFCTLLHRSYFFVVFLVYFSKLFPLSIPTSAPL